MTEQSLVSVGDLADLLHDAFGLILPLESEEAVGWRQRFHDMVDLITSNRQLLKRRIGEAIGAASTCWSDLSGAGEFDSDRASSIVDSLLSTVDAYGETLPLVRRATALSLSEDDPGEALAQTIYDLSAIVAAQNDRWESAPDEVKRVLREVAHELLVSGFVASPPPVQTVESPNTATPEQLADLDEALAYAQYDRGPKLPPNIPMPPGYLSDSERLRRTSSDSFLDLPGAPSEGEVLCRKFGLSGPARSIRRSSLPGIRPRLRTLSSRGSAADSDS